MSKDPNNFEGRGVGLPAEFSNLPEDQRRIGDRFALICGVLPAAIAAVRLSLTDPNAAVAAGLQVVALCRGLAEDEVGDRGLWQTAAELLELSTAASANSCRIEARVRAIDGDDERAAALRVLGLVLATWHAGPAEAICHHLSVIEVLLRWFPARGSVRRCLLTPYVESYWRHVSRERPFAFRAPAVTTAAIEEASAAPESDRIRAVLSAASCGLPIRGAHEILQRLRGPSLEGNTQN
jgi:hypothetical protein